MPDRVVPGPDGAAGPHSYRPERLNSRSPAIGTLGGAALLGGLALAGWQGTVTRSSGASHVGVLVIIGVALGVAVVVGRGRQRTTFSVVARRRRLPSAGAGVGAGAGAGVGVGVGVGTAIWVLLILVTVGWDLYCLARQHHDLPTLSRLCGDVTGHEWGRALFFALWLALGAIVAVGWRARQAPTRQAPTRQAPTHRPKTRQPNGVHQ